MLEHQKIVLNNVAFSKELFRKEIFKSFVWLSFKDFIQLAIWLKNNFWISHKEILLDALFTLILIVHIQY